MTRDVSIISLVLGNVVPLLGVLFWNWDPASIIFTYWLENIVIGFYNVLKMLKAARPTLPDTPPIMVNMPWWKGPIYTRSKRAFVWSFIAFYGFFIAFHGIAAFTFFKPTTLYLTSIMIAVFSLFISHGISYAHNFIGKGEYQKVTPDSLMLDPLKRVFFMQAAVMVGAVAAEVLGAQIFTLVVLVFLKIFVDLLTHRYLHSLIAKLPSQMPEPLESFIKSRVKSEKLSEEETKKMHEIMDNSFQIFIKKIKEKYGK